MRQHRFLASSILVALILCCLPGSSAAQSSNRYSAGLMLGYGGATASEPSSAIVDDVYLLDDQFDLGYQLLFNMEVRRGVLFGVRVGQLDVEVANNAVAFGTPVESDLTYLTLSGEYRFTAGAYQSGLFLGVGYYAVDGQSFFDDDTGLGFTVGSAGDFRINDRWSILVELSGHYADLDSSQFFIMGHGGLAFHF